MISYSKVLDKECLVLLKRNPLCFDLPDAVPERYVSRAIQTGPKTFAINSAPFESTTLTNAFSLESFGIWITKDDATARGAFAPAVFGIPLSERALTALKSFPESLVRVGYHGTSLHAWKSIQAQTLLKPSLGQLGTGVYLGSFWKAARFALRDQAYEWRPSNVVLRVLWIGKSIDTYPGSVPCICTEYCATKCTEKASACAHLRDWRLDAKDGAELRVGQYSDGTWITQNEEWVLKPSNVVRLSEAVQLDRESAVQHRYDPTQRNYRLL